jgi:hypothetical protein
MGRVCAQRVVGALGSSAQRNPQALMVRLRQVRLVFPDIAAAGVGKDPWAEHVRHGWIGQAAIVEDRQGLPDSFVPWLALCNVDRGPDTHQLESLASGIDRHSNAAVCAGKWLHKAPMQAIGRLEFHPVGHWITCSRMALPAAIRHLEIDGVVAVWGRIGGCADGHRRSQKDVIPFDHIQPLRSRAKLELHGGGIFRLLHRWIKGERILGRRDDRAGTQPDRESNRHGGKKQTGYFHAV